MPNEWSDAAIFRYFISLFFLEFLRHKCIRSMVLMTTKVSKTNTSQTLVMRWKCASDFDGLFLFGSFHGTRLRLTHCVTQRLMIHSASTMTMTAGCIHTHTPAPHEWMQLLLIINSEAKFEKNWINIWKTANEMAIPMKNH